MAQPTISELIETLEKAAKDPPVNVEERRQLYRAARRLTLSVETPHDAAQRIYYGGFPLILTIIGIDLGVFKLLSDDPDRLHPLERLAEQTGADPLLLLRVLRGLVAHALVSETPGGKYYANDRTKLFAQDGVIGGAKHNHLHVNPPIQCLPEFLRTTEYRNPKDSSNLPFQLGHGTQQTTFEWLSHRPQSLKWTMAYMSSQRSNQTNWMLEPKVFPVSDFTLASDTGGPDDVLMVDVGGGAGHQCVALRKAHPDLKGRVILQDLPGTIAMVDQNALSNLGIEAQGHDFMTPQPVKGAKVYYMRNILHDWPNASCLTVLKQLRSAMDTHSILIIDEIVVRQSDSTWKQVNYDLVMMCALGGMERTRAQWQDLVSGANLKLRDVVTYDDETGDSILVVEPTGWK